MIVGFDMIVNWQTAWHILWGVKGKVVPVLNQVPCYEVVWWSGGKLHAFLISGES
jgi:hypothetical protein